MHRLESLPRYIGAGPVRLVMREVLSRLIGSSFKSGAVLKKLEVGEDRGRRPDYWLETMKGKSRVLLLQADVEIPSKTSQVAGFCREVCHNILISIIITKMFYSSLDSILHQLLFVHLLE